jgi:hypothetical protein
MNTTNNAINGSNNVNPNKIAEDTLENDLKALDSAQSDIEATQLDSAGTDHAYGVTVGVDEEKAKVSANAGTENGACFKEARAIGRNIVRKLVKREAKALVRSDLATLLANLDARAKSK